MALMDSSISFSNDQVSPEQSLWPFPKSQLALLSGEISEVREQVRYALERGEIPVLSESVVRFEETSD